MGQFLKCYDSPNIRVTVEEIDAFKFIATVWDKNYCAEVDREVYEFETYGGALDKAFDIMGAFCKDEEIKRVTDIAVRTA